ncbi:MAG TPA: nucleotidyltransferase family protein [Bryobacteraceae bacterium]|nr:nucleotidyltransferase family protein [Bryobacteraceae bacterium]
MKTAGLILAAGESRRMGRPKALLEYRGETFLDRLIRLFSAVCSPVIVVLGAEPEAIPAGAQRGEAARFVLNPDYRRGQFSSMQRGLREVPPEAEGVLFTLVDHPVVEAATLASLLAGSGPLRIPRYLGRRGHPIWFSTALTAEFLALPPDATAREVVHRYNAEVEYIDVDDRGVLEDIDEPGDYRRLAGGGHA